MLDWLAGSVIQRSTLKEHSTISQLAVESLAGWSLMLQRVPVLACRKEESIGKTMTLAGPRAWTVAEIIAACEKYAKADAKVLLLTSCRDGLL